MIYFSPKLMEKYGKIIHMNLDDRWTFKKVLYALNWKNRWILYNIEKWLYKQVDEPDQRLLDLIKKEKWDKYSHDSIMTYILRWVKKNKKYNTDINTMKVMEYWNTAIETLLAKEIDCEDGAVFIYVLAKLCGVPDERLHLVTGNVDYKGQLVGHAYLLYKPQYEANMLDITWKVYDWCWYYDNRHTNKRPYYYELKSYKNTWFRVNSTNYYGYYKLK